MEIEVNKMWKYECKRHLLYVIIAMIAGAFLYGFIGFQRETLMAMGMDAINMYQDLPSEYIEILTNLYSNDLFYYILGALEIGGLVNGLMIGYYLLRKYQVNSMIILGIMIFAGSLFITIIELIGAILLIPAMIICIYGMLTIPNKEARKQLKESKQSSLDEFIRLYELHHKIDSSYEKLGKQYRNNVFFQNLLYVIGFVMAFVLIGMFSNNTMIVMAVIVLYFVLYYFVNKIKANLAMPIRSILYNECNPVGCASAIIYASKSPFSKKLVLEQFMAMSLIYMDDPNLAIDALAFSKKPLRNQVDYTYHGLMAYAYYQLGDESMVKKHLDLVETPSNPNSRIQIINMMKLQTIEGIKAKLNMMNQNFTQAKKYYQALLATVRFPSVIVEVHYYLGLISFVEQDFSSALTAFEYVFKHANKMVFKQKADGFILKLQEIMKNEEQEEQ